jgi:hypothetical protein
MKPILKTAAVLCLSLTMTSCWVGYEAWVECDSRHKLPAKLDSSVLEQLLVEHPEYRESILTVERTDNQLTVDLVTSGLHDDDVETVHLQATYDLVDGGRLDSCRRRLKRW